MQNSQMYKTDTTWGLIEKTSFIDYGIAEDNSVIYKSEDESMISGIMVCDYKSAYKFDEGT